MHPDKIKAMGLAVIRTEADAVHALASRIDDSFVRACDIMHAATGRIVVTGMGKSGHIGSKIAATLASTGSPAFFVHPGEASHGDLGMVTSQDVVLALSQSGTTDEILTILPLIKRLHVPLVSMTGNPDSELAQTADVNLNVAVAEEACPLNLAPTASTTAALAMGDALAVSLLEWRGFTAEDFARSHPGGALGRRLLLLISDVMRTGDDIPMVSLGTQLSDAIVEISRKRMGMTLVVDKTGQLAGIFTDGDLRRALDQGVDLHASTIDDLMSRKCANVNPAMLAAEALHIMESHKINALPVLDSAGHIAGALNMHDLLRARVV